MVHRWGSENKDFSAGSQTDFNRSLVRSVAQTTSGPGSSKQGKDRDRVSAKFEFRDERLKSNFSFVFLSTIYSMIGCSKKDRENYPGKCF